MLVVLGCRSSRSLTEFACPAAGSLWPVRSVLDGGLLPAVLRAVLLRQRLDAPFAGGCCADLHPVAAQLRGLRGCSSARQPDRLLGASLLWPVRRVVDDRHHLFRAVWVLCGHLRALHLDLAAFADVRLAPVALQPEKTHLSSMVRTGSGILCNQHCKPVIAGFLKSVSLAGAPRPSCASCMSRSIPLRLPAGHVRPAWTRGVHGCAKGRFAICLFVLPGARIRDISGSAC